MNLCWFHHHMSTHQLHSWSVTWERRIMGKRRTSNQTFNSYSISAGAISLLSTGTKSVSSRTGHPSTTTFWAGSLVSSYTIWTVLLRIRSEGITSYLSSASTYLYRTQSSLMQRLCYRKHDSHILSLHYTHCVIDAALILCCYQYRIPLSDRDSYHVKFVWFNLDSIGFDNVDIMLIYCYVEHCWSAVVMRWYEMEEGHTGKSWHVY